MFTALLPTAARRIRFSNSSCIARNFADSKFNLERLLYNEFGDPLKVLQYEKTQIGIPTDALIVKMMGAPINPADISTIQNMYPLTPKSFPGYPGNEGVGVVCQVGKDPNPHGLKEGSWVIPLPRGAGTWGSYIFGANSDFFEIPKMKLESAATLSINPSTAYRLLKDFVKLVPGDLVIQNGGNSAVGQGVIQLAREMGLKTVSIVRNRNNIDELKANLKALGNENTLILTDEEFNKDRSNYSTKLALNCVGGKAATDLIRSLCYSGVMVTYGGMSRKPIVAPTREFIFQYVELKGFWLSRWLKTCSLSDKQEMYSYLGKLSAERKYKPPKCKLVPISNFKEGIEVAMSEFSNTKVVFTFEQT